MRYPALKPALFALLVLTTGCENSAGWDPRIVTIEGRIVHDGKPVYVREGGIEMELDFVHPDTIARVPVHVDQNGKFVVSAPRGEYRLTSAPGQAPWDAVRDTLTFSASRSTVVQYRVTPYYKVTAVAVGYAPGVLTAAEGSIQALFSIEALDPSRELEHAALYVNTSRRVDQDSSVASALRTPAQLGGSSGDRNISVNLPADIRAVPRASVYARLGLKIVGIPEMIYSQVVEVEIPPVAPPTVTFERLDPRFDALVPLNAVVDTLGDGIQWAEGPAWNRNDNSILFSDVVGNVIMRWKEGEGLSRYLEPSGWLGPEPFTGREPGSNGLIFDSQQRLIMAQHGERRIARREHDGSFTVLASHYNGMRLNSPNDLAYGPNGDLYFTDPPYGLPGTFNSTERELPHYGVYRLTPDGTVHLISAEFSAPNGIGVSPDGNTLFVSNTSGADRGWWTLPLAADGTAGPRSRFRMQSESGPGGSDGLKFDRDGNLWATGPGGVHVISPEGTLLGRIITGVPTGNIAWGDDMSVLYITANTRLLRVRTNAEGFPGFQHE